MGACREAERLLTASGIYYTRILDLYDTPAEKVQKANASEADLFVSFHLKVAQAEAKGRKVFVFSNIGAKAELAHSLCRKY